MRLGLATSWLAFEGLVAPLTRLLAGQLRVPSFWLLVANLAADGGFSSGQEVPRAGKRLIFSLAGGQDVRAADFIQRTHSCQVKLLKRDSSRTKVTYGDIPAISHSSNCPPSTNSPSEFLCRGTESKICYRPPSPDCTPQPSCQRFEGSCLRC